MGNTYIKGQLTSSRKETACHPILLPVPSFSVLASSSPLLHLEALEEHSSPLRGS